MTNEEIELMEQMTIEQIAIELTEINDDLIESYTLLEIKCNQSEYYSANWIFANTEALIAYSNRLEYEIVTNFDGNLCFHNDVWEYVYA